MKRIDIGCGGTLKRAAKGYDVYTDIIRAIDVLPGEFIQCPMENMESFTRTQFDFARCHHVLEHTQDPDKACNELIRIAKAGIISFPPMQAEIQFGRKDHRWFVCIDKGRLLFIKKRHPSYGIPRRVTMCELNVNFEWEESFRWQTVL